MQTSYHIEIWVPIASYQKVRRIMGVKPKGKPRSILKADHTVFAGEPSSIDLQAMLDMLETKSALLEKANISRASQAIWVECAYEERFSFALDALTLLRFGEDEIKLCLRSWQEGWLNQWQETLAPATRLVEITDIGIALDAEAPEAESREVTVSFDDGTYWRAYFVCPGFNGEWENLSENAFFWKPNMILVQNLEEESIERVVIQLLQERRFEMVFHCLNEPSRVNDRLGKTRFDLRIMCQSDRQTELARLLHADHQEVIHQPYFLTLRQFGEKGQEFQQIKTYLQLIDQHFPRLSEKGIQRQDVTIDWQCQHQGPVNHEFPPEIMWEMGKRGIGLNIVYSEATSGIARCLD